MAQAVPISDNYGVEKEVIEDLQLEMMIQAEQFDTDEEESIDTDEESSIGR